MDGGGDGYECMGRCPMHACMHTHAHARMHMHVKHVVNMINMDASMSSATCNFYTCIKCVCVHARA